MNNKYILFIVAILSLALYSCSVEIPENEAAVLISELTDEVYPEVLTSGKYNISPFSVLVYYDIEEKQKTYEFDILTKDVHSGNIKTSIIYTPKAENLSKIHKKYELSQMSDDYSLDLLIAQEFKSRIRDLILNNYNKTDIDRIQLDSVESIISSIEPFNELVSISHFHIDEITFED